MLITTIAVIPCGETNSVDLLLLLLVTKRGMTLWNDVPTREADLAEPIRKKLKISSNSLFLKTRFVFSFLFIPYVAIIKVGGNFISAMNDSNDFQQNSLLLYVRFLLVLLFAQKNTYESPTSHL